jgi:hypothetical protein
MTVSSARCFFSSKLLILGLAVLDAALFIRVYRAGLEPGGPDLHGALQLTGADPGVLTTRGDFSKSAIDIAAKAKSVIVLINDAEMARLIVKFEVGAKHWAMKVPTLATSDTEHTRRWPGSPAGSR